VRARGAGRIIGGSNFAFRICRNAAFAFGANPNSIDINGDDQPMSFNGNAMSPNSKSLTETVDARAFLANDRQATSNCLRYTSVSNRRSAILIPAAKLPVILITGSEGKRICNG